MIKALQGIEHGPGHLPGLFRLAGIVGGLAAARLGRHLDITPGILEQPDRGKADRRTEEIDQARDEQADSGTGFAVHAVAFSAHGSLQTMRESGTRFPSRIRQCPGDFMAPAMLPAYAPPPRKTSTGSSIYWSSSLQCTGVDGDALRNRGKAGRHAA